jgi:signal transduction histidine kinase
MITGGSPTAPGHVAVIHLSPSRADALARILRVGSHRVTIVGTGPGAVSTLVAAAPDLILGPLFCGEMTLAELSDQVRQRMGSDLMVLAILGREDGDAVVEADGIIREPVDAGELLFRTGRLLRQAAERRLLQHKVDALLGLQRVASWAFSIAGGAESLFGHLARQSADLLKAEKGLIVLYDPQRREMEGQNVAFGFSPDQVARIRYPVDGEARDLWNFRLNGPLLTNNARTDSRLLPDLSAIMDVSSLAMVPMTRGPQVLGLIVVADRVGGAPFRDEDLATLQAVAGQATVAVENQRLHEQIKEANARLQEFDRRKSEFVATVAHDFRSPLMAIRGFAELTLEEPDLPPERRSEFMRTIMAETDDLARLANDTLLISHMETGQLHYDWMPLDVRRELKDAIPPGLTHHDIVVDVPDDFPVIKADPLRLRQVLNNLVSNALKYSPSGGTVTLRARERGRDQVIIEVTDEGLGVPADQAGRLFQKFERVRSQEHMKIPGTGLGLYICKRIVEGHHGRIWVESEPGGGSTFAFTLPLDPALHQAEEAPGGRAQRSSST